MSVQAERTIELRPYQVEAAAAWRQRRAAGIQRGIISLPTGCGKTILALSIARETPGRTLWLAHRDELIEQPLRALQAVWPDADAGVVKAERDEVDAQIVFASVQTASRTNRLARLTRSGTFDLVVVDEAHHAVAPSYRRILMETGTMDPGGPPALGLTATVERGDQLGLDAVWEVIVYQLQLLEAIQAGWLVDIRVERVHLDIDLDAIHVVNGDFAVGELDEAMLRAGAAEATADAYVRYAEGRKALVFTVSVDQARRTAEALRRRGVAAEWVSGDLPLDERRAILRRLHTGETMVVANCAVLTEGFDEPSVSAVVVARPTRSKTLYLQMIGRGTRRHPGKEDLLIIDLVGAAREHTFIQAPTLMGLRPEDLVGKTVRQAVEERALRGSKEDALVQAYVRASVRGGGARQRIRWIQPEGGLYAVSAGHDTILIVAAGDGWTVHVVPKDRSRAPSALQARPVYLELALGIAEDYVRRVEAMRLVRDDLEWRRKPASAKQLEALRRWRVPVHRQLTAGEATDLLTAAIARAARQRIGRRAA